MVFANPIGVNDSLADWLTPDDLLALGVSPEVVAALPTDHTGHDGPCWHRDDLDDLLTPTHEEGR